MEELDERLNNYIAKKEEPIVTSEQEEKTEHQPSKTATTSKADLDYEIKMLERELEYKKQLRKKQSDFEM